MTLPFADWLAEQAGRTDRVGDLARDARMDAEWPSSGKISRRRLRAYLESRGAIPDALDTLDEAWDEWDAQRRAGRA